MATSEAMVGRRPWRISASTERQSRPSSAIRNTLEGASPERTCCGTSAVARCSDASRSREGSARTVVAPIAADRIAEDRRAAVALARGLSRLTVTANTTARPEPRRRSSTAPTWLRCGRTDSHWCAGSSRPNQKSPRKNVHETPTTCAGRTLVRRTRHQTMAANCTHASGPANARVNQTANTAASAGPSPFGPALRTATSAAGATAHAPARATRRITCYDIPSDGWESTNERWMRCQNVRISGRENTTRLYRS